MVEIVPLVKLEMVASLDVASRKPGRLGPHSAPLALDTLWSPLHARIARDEFAYPDVLKCSAPACEIQSREPNEWRMTESRWGTRNGLNLDDLETN
jgi:hypothetical protein